MRIRHIIPVLATLLCTTACNKTDHIAPIDTDQPCMVVYTVDDQESHTTVRNNTEWDALINQFCDYAQEGKSVTFYNLSSQPNDIYANKGLASNDNTATTISTTSREEIKAWMRKMEQSGKTVNITYNQQTGVWNGTAYTHIPAIQDTTVFPTYSGVITTATLPGTGHGPMGNISVMALRVNADTTLLIARNNYMIAAGNGFEGYEIGDSATLSGTIRIIDDIAEEPILILDLSPDPQITIIGKWHFAYMTVYSFDNNYNYLTTVSQYIPEENGTTIYYDFYTDGTATRSESGGIGQTITGTWSMSGTDQLCCDLAEMDGGCWSITWISPETLIMIRIGIDSENREVLHQLLFEKANVTD